jgi:ABC-type dipeptide/oligopeptide/nickel transport system ATPase subunit
MHLKPVQLDKAALTSLVKRQFQLKKHDGLTPTYIINKPTCADVDGQLHRVIYAQGYPRTVEDGWLDKLITAEGNFDISIHVEPYPTEQTLVMLNKELQKQRADLYAAQLKSQFLPSLEIQYNDTKSVLESIQRGENRLFQVSLYLDIKAKDLKELEKQTRRATAYLNSMLIVPKTPVFRITAALQGMLPHANNVLAKRRFITTTALGAFFPFTSPFLILEDQGVFLGLNKNGLPIIKDIFALNNANGAILATSGSGKSYTAKLLISRYLMSGTKVIVIDPQGEYTKLAKEYKGSIIDISRSSETVINPLDLLGHSFVDKRLALLDLFNIMFGQLTEGQRAILDRAVSKTYALRGINEDTKEPTDPPTLGDLYHQLEVLRRQSTAFERSSYATLQNRLSMYVDGVFSFLNKPTKIKLDNNFVVFNIGDMPRQVKPVMMFLLLDYIYMRMKQDRERKLLVIDEAWSLLQHAQDQSYVFEIVKTCRKFNLGLLMITQDVADLLNSTAGRAVLANSSYTVLLRQKASIINSVQEVFHLSYEEREHLMTSSPGQGLLMMDNDHHEIRIVASDKEHRLITTNADELLTIEGETAPGTTPAIKKVLIELDLAKGFYRKSALSPEEVDYLNRNGFQESEHVPIRNKAHAVFLVRKEGRHSAEHTFLTNAVYEELLLHTPDVRLHSSVRVDPINPDIVFTDRHGRKCALEIETGINLKHNKEYTQEKVKNLNKKFGQNWWFLISDARWRTRYQTISGNNVLIRHDLPRFCNIHIGRTLPSPYDITKRSLKKNIDEKTAPLKLHKESESCQTRQRTPSASRPKQGGHHNGTRTRTKKSKKMPRMRRLPTPKR